MTQTPLPERPTLRAVRIFIDADACPVRDETYRVAQRYGLHTYVVANQLLGVPASPLIERIVVSEGMDEADNWIADQVQAHDIVISGDIPLAARCVAKGACVLDARGRVLNENAIGMALAIRNLMDDLRSTGAITQGGRSYSKSDRSTFLSALDTAVVKARKKAAQPVRSAPFIPPAI
ncbi:MAG: YaiI/YqxD family protein [Acetobacter sp.]|uniref:YaiI/YqxD family protein n=1 Tax=Acetobacter sp. TaxID=440 RepID=UPI003F931A35